MPPIVHIPRPLNTERRTPNTSRLRPLPPDLPEGAQITLETFDHGYWTLNYNGRRFMFPPPWP
jgi:hypothetical protein